MNVVTALNFKNAVGTTGKTFWPSWILCTVLNGLTVFVLVAAVALGWRLA